MDKKLKMFLVSDTDLEGSQWWVIDYSAEEAAAQIQKNWPDCGPFVAEQVTSNEKQWGHFLSLDPSSNDKRELISTEELLAEYTKPDVYAAGGGGMMYRHNIDGESNQEFVYDDTGTKVDPKDLPLMIPQYEDEDLAILPQKSHIDIRIGGENGRVVKLARGHLWSGLVKIVHMTQDHCNFGLINFYRNHEQRFYLFGSIYAYRRGTRWKRMDQDEFKVFERFVEDNTHLDYKKVLKAIRKNEVDEEW